MKIKRALAAMTAAASLLMVAASAGAAERDLRAAPTLPANHPTNGVLYVNFAKYLPEETGGALGATILGPEIVDMRGVKNALDTGLAEVGSLLPLYMPSDLPNFSSAGDLALLGRDPQAVSAAMTEFIVTCEDCQAELSRAGLVYINSNSSDAYFLVTNEPVRTRDDLKGMRLRSGGAPYSRWAEAAGATPVSLPQTETFEALSQGAIDGSMTSITDLVTMRLMDVAKYVTPVTLGTYNTTSQFTFSRPVWSSFSEEQRMGVIRAAERAMVDFVQEGYIDRGEPTRKEAMANGVEFIEPDPSLVEFTNAFAIDDIQTAIKIAEDTYHVKGAAEKFQHYRDLMAKWEKISREANGDRGKLVEARISEIWSKVDLASYGQ